MLQIVQETHVQKLIFLFLFLLVTSLTALETLVVKLGDDAFFEKQVKLLINGTVEEKISAIYNLRAVKSKRALRPLILALRGASSHSSKEVKSVTQEINPDGDYSIINLNIPQNKIPAIRFLAAQGLAEIRHEIAVKPLLETYKEFSEILAKKKNQRVFFEKFEDMPDVVAAGEVLKALGFLMPDAENKEIVDVLSEALNHEHYYIRAAAAEGFANSDRDTMIPIIEAAVAKEKDEIAKATMHASIVDIRKTNTKHFFELIELLKSPNPYVRLKVSSLLGMLAIENSETYLRQAMQIEDSISVKNQMKSDIVLITTYEVPNAPSASYGSELDRNKKSDTK
jgi:HEAT repeat protein